MQVAAAPPVADERALPIEQNEPPGIAHRQHPKQCLVDEGENRRVRADAKTDRQQRRQRESAVLPQRYESPAGRRAGSSRSCPRWTPAGRKGLVAV